MRAIQTLIGVCTLLASAAVMAGARDDLNGFTKGLKGLDAPFTQKVFDTKGKLKESSTGRVALSAPRQFRWEYVKPFPQLIVADGKTVWVYDPDLQQVTRRPQGNAEQSSPLTALIDPASLDKRFIVQDNGAVDGLNWMTLLPKGDVGEASFRSAKLGFDKTGLRRMTVVDQLGQRTELQFDGWKRNPAFAAGTFKYVPAKDVDVIGG